MENKLSEEKIIEDIKEELEGSLSTAVSIVKVENNEEAESITDVVKTLNLLKDKVEKYFKPIKENAFKLHRQIVAKEKTEIIPIVAEIIRLRLMVQVYMTEQRKIKEEAERVEREQLAKKEAELLADAEKEEDIVMKEMFKANAVDVKKEVGNICSSGGISRVITGVSSSKDIEISICDKFKLCESIVKNKIPQDFINITLDVRAVKKWMKENAIKEVDGLEIKDIENLRMKK